MEEVDGEPEGPLSVGSFVESLVRFRGRVSGSDIVVAMTEHCHADYHTYALCHGT